MFYILEIVYNELSIFRNGTTKVSFETRSAENWRSTLEEYRSIKLKPNIPFERSDYRAESLKFEIPKVSRNEWNIGISLLLVEYWLNIQDIDKSNHPLDYSWFRTMGISSLKFHQFNPEKLRGYTEKKLPAKNFTRCFKN